MISLHQKKLQNINLLLQKKYQKKSKVKQQSLYQEDFLKNYKIRLQLIKAKSKINIHHYLKDGE